MEGYPPRLFIKEEENSYMDKTRKYLKSTGDTHSGITWQKFIEIAKSYGFKCGFHHKFTGTGRSLSNKPCVEEEEIIFFHEKKGLILYAGSFNGGTSVKNATVYGEVKINKWSDFSLMNDEQIEALKDCSVGAWQNGAMPFNVDVRDGLCLQLDALSKLFTLSKTWSRVPFLRFLNYMEIKDKNCTIEKTNKRKIASCSPEVRKIIFG